MKFSAVRYFRSVLLTFRIFADRSFQVLGLSALIASVPAHASCHKLKMKFVP